MDKHLWVQSFGYKLDVNNNSVVFSGVTEGQDITDAKLLEVINNTVQNMVAKRYPGGFKFDSEITAMNGGVNKYQIMMTISGKEPEDMNARKGAV